MIFTDAAERKYVDELIAERNGFSAALMQEELRANALHAELVALRAKLDAALALTNINVEAELHATRAKLNALQHQYASLDLKLRIAQDELAACRSPLEKAEKSVVITKLALKEQDQRNQDLLGIRNTLQAKLDASERAAAEMRTALQGIINHCVHPDKAVRAVMVDLTPIRFALSSDAGRDYVPRSEVDAAWRKGMTDAVGVVNGTFLGYNSQDGADMDFKAQAMTNIEAARDAKPTSALPRS